MNRPHPHRTQLIGTRSKQKARDPRLHAVDVTMVSQGPGCKGQGQGRARRGKGFQPECDPAMRAGASRPSAWCHTQVRGSTGAGPPLWPCGRVGPSCVLPLGSQHVCQHCSAKDTLGVEGPLPCAHSHVVPSETPSCAQEWRPGEEGEGGEHACSLLGPVHSRSPSSLARWGSHPHSPKLSLQPSLRHLHCTLVCRPPGPPWSAPRVSSPSLVAGWGPHRCSGPPPFHASYRICFKTTPRVQPSNALCSPVTLTKCISHHEYLLAHRSNPPDYQLHGGKNAEVISPFNYPLAKCLTHSRHQLTVDE